MPCSSRIIWRTNEVVCLLPAGLTGCKATGNDSNGAAPQPLPNSGAASAPPQTADEAPSPDKTGGFDGKRAFAQVAKQLSFGPRPSGSPAIAQLQEYMLSELKSYGCLVETDSFGSDTRIGRVPRENILVKIPAESRPNIGRGTRHDSASPTHAPR